MNEQTIHELEVSMEEAKIHIELMEALKRLEENADFRRVIGEEYFKQEAIRLVHLKSDKEMLAPERAQNVDNAMIAIGKLNEFFNRIWQFGYMAQQTFAEAEAARNEEFTSAAETMN